MFRTKLRIPYSACTNHTGRIYFLSGSTFPSEVRSFLILCDDADIVQSFRCLTSFGQVWFMLQNFFKPFFKPRGFPNSQISIAHPVDPEDKHIKRSYILQYLCNTMYVKFLIEVWGEERGNGGRQRGGSLSLYSTSSRNTK